MNTVTDTFDQKISQMWAQLQGLQIQLDIRAQELTALNRAIAERLSMKKDTSPKQKDTILNGR